MRFPARLFVVALAAVAVGQLGLPSCALAQAKSKVNPGDGLTYVWIAPGSFEMGVNERIAVKVIDDRGIESPKAVALG